MIILDKILAVFAPFECLICDAEDDLLCSACTRKIPIEPICCFGCRQPLGQDNCATPKCIKNPINRLYSVAPYMGIYKDMVLNLKSRGIISSAGLMAEMMAKNIPRNSELVITHIPTASNRIRLRGFDHSALLAREISKITKLPNIKFLLRNNQSRQVGATKAERLKNIKSAFRVQNSQCLKGARILLVDDVLTTGATLETAARVLLSAGAESVDVVVFAVA